MKTEYENTINRSVYNKLRKQKLESIGDIRCTYCGYHKNENITTNWYGGFDNIDNVKRPNWKLVSNNKKQWMKNSVSIKRWNGTFILYELIW